MEKTLEEQKAKTKSKADTIKQLMNEIEMQCHKLQAVEKGMTHSAGQQSCSILTQHTYRATQVYTLPYQHSNHDPT